MSAENCEKEIAELAEAKMRLEAHQSNPLDWGDDSTEDSRGAYQTRLEELRSAVARAEAALADCRKRKTR
jgi:hypothetical protein